MKVAVIGSGISGLSTALKLHRHASVSLFEASAGLGGHANTVDVTLDGQTHPVDTGFLVFNEKTYPNLLELFAQLQVPYVPSDMSFAVSTGPHQFEWCGTSLSSLFAQPSNALSLRFWRMLRDVLRFNREASALAIAHDGQTPQGPLADPDAERRVSGVNATRGAVRDQDRMQPPLATPLNEPLGNYLAREGYSDAFRDLYLLPMAAAIWSCPMKTMLQFPLGSFVRFFHNHGLLQVENRPQWFTVLNGSREYVRRIADQLDDIRLDSPVHSVRRQPGAGVLLESRHGIEQFDQVVLACHSDQALRLLADASPQERAVLGAIPYQANRGWLHTDTRLMPRRRSAWAAWNYLSDGSTASPSVSVTYWLNRLQPLPFKTPLLLSLNPLSEPAPEHRVMHFDYEHPIFDTGALQAQRELASLQGHNATWYAGAWTGYGFHEDGLRSGISVAKTMLERLAQPGNGPALAAHVPIAA